MFSQLLGLGTGLMGMFQANSQMEYQYAMYMQQLQDQRDQRTMMYGLAMDAQKDTDERNAELRQWESWAKQTAATERQYQIQESERYADQLLSERQFEIDRQVRADQEAARIQAFRLEQMLTNQRLAGEEREFAIAQLRQAQEIASSERTEDLTRYYQNKAKAEIQRDFMMGVFQDAQGIAREDQNRDLAVRDRVTGQIDRLQGTVQAAYDSMGSAPTVERLTRGDIDNEIARRTAQYTSDVDRAADRVASVNEADLIRGGMDRSTTGTASRGEIAGRLADEYQTARARAYDDALKFITGQSQSLTANVNDIMANRGAILSEVGGVAGLGLDALNNLPGVTSRMGALDAARLVGDGTYDRGISSANTYSAPVGIGSGIYDSGFYTLTPGMSEYGVGNSAAFNRSTGIGSSITNPVNLAMESPGTYFGYAANNSANMLNAYGNMYNNAQSNASGATSGFFGDLNEFVNDYGGSINKKLGSWFGLGDMGRQDNINRASRGRYGK
jgi:hypothetical protein